MKTLRNIALAASFAIATAATGATAQISEAFHVGTEGALMAVAPEAKTISVSFVLPDFDATTVVLDRVSANAGSGTMVKNGTVYGVYVVTEADGRTDLFIAPSDDATMAGSSVYSFGQEAAAALY